MPPKKGTPKYEAWILTPEYTDLIRRNKSEKMRIAASKANTGRKPWHAGNKGENTPNYGNRHTEEFSILASERFTGEGNPMFGRKRPDVIIRNKSEEMRKKVSASQAGVKKSERAIISQLEYNRGGLWYGNVDNDPREYYCEAWNPGLWIRIDIAQDFKSILSGKTKEDNRDRNGKPRNLTRHHVYWQKRACCGFDEDTQGYYAMINIGTPMKPNWYKHYIDGSPNKFVLLTDEEHGMIKKDKIKWIRIFEELIKTKLNGKCYLTKNEMEGIDVRWNYKSKLFEVV